MDPFYTRGRCKDLDVYWSPQSSFALSKRTIRDNSEKLFFQQNLEFVETFLKIRRDWIRAMMISKIFVSEHGQMMIVVIFLLRDLKKKENLEFVIALKTWPETLTWYLYKKHTLFKIKIRFYLYEILIWKVYIN